MKGDYTIGICSTNDKGTVERLLSILEKDVKRDPRIAEIIAVVSGSVDGTREILETYSTSLPLRLIVEGERRGKSEAINRIMDAMTGRHLVLINADAVPEEGALPRLISAMEGTEYAAICAFPVLASLPWNPTSLAVELLWMVHNETMKTLEEKGLQINLTDEMLAIRSSYITRLPEETINDGAYLAMYIKRKGGRISFCSDARVCVSAPASLAQLLEQRRRILLGHLELVSAMKELPPTVEFKLLGNSVPAGRIVTRVLRQKPALLSVVPLLLMIEVVAMAGAARDWKRKVKKHIWKRVNNAAWSAERR